VGRKRGLLCHFVFVVLWTEGKCWFCAFVFSHIGEEGLRATIIRTKALPAFSKGVIVGLSGGDGGQKLLLGVVEAQVKFENRSEVKILGAFC